MHRYHLTNAAEIDLENILEFGLDSFGEDVAIDYYDKLVSHFSHIAKNPQQYPSRHEIRENYRLCSYRSHDIYFQVKEDSVLIVRILNRQSVERAIKKVMS